MNCSCKFLFQYENERESERKIVFGLQQALEIMLDDPLQ